MKIIKIIGIIVLALAVLIGIAAFIIPTKSRTEQIITINASKAVVWSNLKYFRNFPKWSPWHKLDPKMHVDYIGEDGTVNSGYKWAGNDDVGTGEQYMKTIEEEKSITMSLKFGDFPGSNISGYNMSDLGDGTIKVMWYMDSEMPRPFNIMSYLMGGAIEKDFINGLNNLKTLCEKETADEIVSKEKYKIEETDLAESWLIGIKKTVGFDQAGEFFGTAFEKIMKTMKPDMKSPMPIALGLYFTWDENTKTSEMAAVIASDAKTTAPGLEKFHIAAGKAIQLTHRGSYESIVDAHMFIAEYLKQHQLEARMPCIETYVKGPMNEKDTAHWETIVIYPLKN